MDQKVMDQKGVMMMMYQEGSWVPLTIGYEQNSPRHGYGQG